MKLRWPWPKTTTSRPAWQLHLLRLLLLVVLCTLALQATWLTRVALMRFIDPQSTSFQRSEIWRLLVRDHTLAWSQGWLDAPALGKQLPRAAIASEDAGFTQHGGVDWEAVQTAWDRNRSAAARAERAAASAKNNPRSRRPVAPKVVGGSTISQQLAKNLFFSGERTVARKAQELVVTLMLEALLSKQRILEIYLNHVEWGEGVFGAEAAALHYFRTPPVRLSAEQAARLAVMLPAPKRFEKAPASGYLLGRAATITARMPAVETP